MNLRPLAAAILMATSATTSRKTGGRGRIARSMRRYLDGFKPSERQVRMTATRSDGMLDEKSRDEQVLHVQTAAYVWGAKTSPVEIDAGGNAHLRLYGTSRAVDRTMESLVRAAAREGSQITVEP